MFDGIKEYILFILNNENTLISKLMITLLIMLFSLYILFKKEIDKKIKKILKIKDETNVVIEDKIGMRIKNYKIIKNNNLIIYIDDILNLQVNQIDFGDKRKNKLYVDFITIPLNLFKKYIIKISEKEDINEITPEEFKKYIMDIIYEYSNEVSLKMKNEFGNDIFDILNKKEVYNTFSNFTIDNIKHILSNREKEDNNIVILLSIFAILIFYLKHMFETTTNRYKSINGVLDDIINKRYK